MNKEIRKNQTGYGKMWKSKGDGSEYVGEIVKGRPQGFGTLTTSDGLTYVGEFLNGLPNGKGIEIHGNSMETLEGIRYEGNFENGRFDGKGVIIHPFGNKFEGHFKKGEPDGDLTMTSIDGEVSIVSSKI